MKDKQLKSTTSVEQLLFEPITRAVQYRNLFNKILENFTKHEHTTPEIVNSMKRAQDTVDFLIKNLNDSMSFSSIIFNDDLHINFSDTKFIGKFIKCDDFRIFYGTRKYNGRIFLFETILIITEQLRPISASDDTPSYKYCGHILVPSITKTEDNRMHVTGSFGTDILILMNVEGQQVFQIWAQFFDKIHRRSELFFCDCFPAQRGFTRAQIFMLCKKETCGIFGAQ